MFLSYKAFYSSTIYIFSVGAVYKQKCNHKVSY